MEFIVTIQEPEIQVVYVATQGEQGVAGLIWIDGGWTDATDYVVDNALEHNGSSYRSTRKPSCNPRKHGSWRFSRGRTMSVNCAYTIIDVDDIDLDILSGCSETNLSNLRKNDDGTKAILKWPITDGEPTWIDTLGLTIYLRLEIIEILDDLEGEWQGLTSSSSESSESSSSG